MYFLPLHLFLVTSQKRKKRDKNNGDFAYTLGTVVLLVREKACLLPDIQTPAWLLLPLWGYLESGSERMKEPNKENRRGSHPCSVIFRRLLSCSSGQKQRCFLGALSLSARGAHFCFQIPREYIPRNSGGGHPRKFNASCMVLWVWFPSLLPLTFQSHQRAAYVLYGSFESHSVGRAE